MGITKQEGQEIRKLKRIVDIGLAVLLVVIVIVTVKIIKMDFSKIGQEPSAEDLNIPLASDPTGADGQSIFVSEAIDNEKINQGTLILVNSGAEYKWSEDGLKSIMEVRNSDDTDCYEVMDNDVMARTEAAQAINTMLKDFSKETGLEDIRVDSAYRSVEEQESIYENAEDKTHASRPGFSDYHTGYSIDLNVVSEDGESLDFDGEGDYEWLIKNCWKYGFVLRSPKGKESMTGMDYRPWHFRYVGKVHAAYMAENGLCLEEYIQKLKSYPYDGDHLKTEDADGSKYEIYYFAADTASTMTSVAVPSDQTYEISGNNSDGFIITILTEKGKGMSKPSSGDSSESSRDEDSSGDDEEDGEADEDAEE